MPRMFLHDNHDMHLLPSLPVWHPAFTLPYRLVIKRKGMSHHYFHECTATPVLVLATCDHRTADVAPGWSFGRLLENVQVAFFFLTSSAVSSIYGDTSSDVYV